MGVSEALLRGAYLVLAVACLLICWQQFLHYLALPRGTAVEEVTLTSRDLPWLAVCPQPSLNIGHPWLEKHVNKTTLQKLKWGQVVTNFFEEFGSIVSGEDMDSAGVLQFYKDLSVDSTEVVPAAHLLLENGTRLELTRGFLALPNGETFDCPAFIPPEGITQPAALKWGPQHSLFTLQVDP